MADGSPTDLWPQQKEILAVVEAAVVAKQPGFRSVFPHGTPYRVLIDFVVFLLTNVMVHFFLLSLFTFSFFFRWEFFSPTICSRIYRFKTLIFISLGQVSWQFFHIAKFYCPYFGILSQFSILWRKITTINFCMDSLQFELCTGWSSSTRWSLPRACWRNCWQTRPQPLRMLNYSRKPPQR